MNDSDFFINQSGKRQYYLDLILSSSVRKKIIVAGPGTGKTHTFKRVLEKTQSNNNLALTFINKLVEDMEKELSDFAEVKTFHAFCKKILHEKIGRVDLVPFLTKVISNDAKLLNYSYNKFDEKFRCLKDDSPEIRFYLIRGDYYKSVAFDDSVYRLLQHIKNGNVNLPYFNQIVIDEYQDFNPLETAFIEELEKKSPILIVGDDDQAVYDMRSSSPDYLRNKYHSGDYETFQLPFCSRCPKVIVEATNAFIDGAIKNGNLLSRIPRPFFPYIQGKEEENLKYPRIIRGTTTTIKVMSMYISKIIQNISKEEIEDSYNKNYPCVLIVGTKEYLNPVYKHLRNQFVNVAIKITSDITYTISDAYQILLSDTESNIGWRLLAEFNFSYDELKIFISKTLNGTSMLDVLPDDFIDRQNKIIDYLRDLCMGIDVNNEIYEMLENQAEEVIKHILKLDQEEELNGDRTTPQILLTTYQGCKGLSAGHVFIIGLNDGKFPKCINNKIKAVEYSKFIVALTRTRKCCYLLSNKWDYSPGGNPPFTNSKFLNLIPMPLIENRGTINAKIAKLII